MKLDRYADFSKENLAEAFMEMMEVVKDNMSSDQLEKEFGLQRLNDLRNLYNDLVMAYNVTEGK